MSAVVVNYNYQAFLPAAVESLLVQTDPFDEVLVVDDGSTDDSLGALVPFAGRVTVVSKENGGQLGACRVGLARCSSDYVYFLDADDLAAPDLLSVIRPRLASGPVKVQFQLRAVDAVAAPVDSVFPTYPDGYDSAAMVADNAIAGLYLCPPTSGNVFRVDTLRRLALQDLDQRDFIDGPPNFVMPHLGEVISLAQPLASYRLHGNNHSQWGQPTSALLRHEMCWFVDRWRQAGELLGTQRLPYGDQEGDGAPTYLLERIMLVAALDGQRFVLPDAHRFVRRMWSSHLPRNQKAVLTLWSLMLLVPWQRWRNYVVTVRRSPQRRPDVLRRLVRWVRR